ncbi:response regulator transcription factor [uncultured Draconibacterium sp.]|uniref:response regulator transcription factor n=1 Tax=uncultured Draconibacterium sp. TaxID=1573823 RepID=UPI0025EDDC55|nr:response regulator transcription factor [uncultured Draconibacterium sp.]
MNQSERKKIILVDDNTICREALKLLFNEASGFQVVACYTSLDEIKNAEDLDSGELFLLSYTLPFEDLIPVADWLKKRYTDIPAILINVGKADNVVLQGIMNGIKGIIWKSDSTGELLYACNKILNGDRYLRINERDLKSDTAKLKTNKEYLDKISTRELTVLKLFAKGYSYKQIGEELSISPRTVESHKNNILVKLGIGSLKELIGYAVKNNIV